MINQGNQFDPPKPSRGPLMPSGQPSVGMPVTEEQKLGMFAPSGEPSHCNSDDSADHASAADEALAEFRGIGHSERISSATSKTGRPAELPTNGYDSPANLEMFGPTNGRVDKG